MKPRVAVLSRHPDGALRDAETHKLDACEIMAMVRFDGSLYFGISVPLNPFTNSICNQFMPAFQMPYNIHMHPYPQLNPPFNPDSPIHNPNTQNQRTSPIQFSPIPEPPTTPSDQTAPLNPLYTQVAVEPEGLQDTTIR